MSLTPEEAAIRMKQFSNLAHKWRADALATTRYLEEQPKLSASAIAVLHHDATALSECARQVEEILSGEAVQCLGIPV